MAGTTEPFAGRPDRLDRWLWPVLRPLESRCVAAALWTLERALEGKSVRLYVYTPENDRLVPVASARMALGRRRLPVRRRTHPWWLSRLHRTGEPRLASVVEIGVNYGYTTTWLANIAERVVVVEPHPKNVAFIEEHRRIRRLDNVEIVQAAAADAAGEATLHVKEVDGHHSLGDIGAGPTVERIAVKTTTLDDLAESHRLDRIDVLKIDVEGFEPEVLRGGSGLLEAGRVRTIVFEFSPGFYQQRGLDPAAPLSLLDACGYAIIDETGAAVEAAGAGSRGQADLLAYPRGCGEAARRSGARA